MRVLVLLWVLVLAWVDRIQGINVGRVLGGGMMSMRSRGGGAAVHHDASTGTITELTPEQEGKAKSAFTCDNVLAKSLVEANEVKYEAEQERDTLRVQLSARDAHILDLNSQLAETEKALHANQTEIKRLVGIATAERKAFREEADALAAKQISDHQKSVDDLIASLKQTIQDMEVAHQDTVNEKELKLQSVLKQSLDEKEKLLKQHEQSSSKLLADHDEHKSRLQEEHEKVVATLKEEMSTKEKAAIDELTAKEKAMEEEFKLLKQESKSQLSAARSDHGKEKSNLMKSIQSLEKDVKKMSDDIHALQNKYDAARDEIASWEDLHGSRSYCNFTHISEDSWAATVATSKVASDHLVVGAAYVAKVSEPHVKTAKQMYDTHLKEHVDKHYTPIHEKHLVPLVATAVNLAGQLAGQATKLSEVVHAKMTAGVEAVCPTAKKASQNSNDTIQKAVEKECEDPARLVDKIVLFSLLLLVLIFRKFLWRTLKKITFFPFKVLWYCTPLPLLFGRKPQSAGKAEANAVKAQSEAQ